MSSSSPKRAGAGVDAAAPLAALPSAPQHPHQHPSDDVQDDAKQLEEASSSPSSSSSHPPAAPKWRTRLSTHLSQPLTHNSCTLPLSLLALLTGLIDGLLYSRTSVWIGFQTGNIVQFSMGIASFIYEAHLPERERPPPRLLTGLRALSFVSFFIASWAGSWMASGRLWRGKSVATQRLFLITSSFIQSLLLFGASAILWARDTSPTTPVTAHTFAPVILLTALSMGLQSIQSQKLSSPVFSTSVAYTATLTQLAADPELFTPRISWLARGKEGDKVRGRDLRILALVCLAIGGGVSQSLLISDAGLRGGLTVAAGLKLLLVAVWMLPRGATPVKGTP